MNTFQNIHSQRIWKYQILNGISDGHKYWINLKLIRLFELQPKIYNTGFWISLTPRENPDWSDIQAWNNIVDVGHSDK